MSLKVLLAIILSLHLTICSATPIKLMAIEENLSVDGKTTPVFNLVQPNGMQGFVGKKGGYFDVSVVNKTSVPISIHWHGLILPNNQDGVPYVTQLPISPGKSHHYYFKLLQAGTFWMHSHFKFHEQQLMTAPFIIQDPEKRNDSQEVIVMLQEFTTKSPEKIFYDLQHNKMTEHMNMSGMHDLNDVDYDAYLANRKTLTKPDIVTVTAGKKVRLRIINGSSASNFWVNTGKLMAEAIAVDGNDITPIRNTHFQIAVAQRMDLEVTIPTSGGVFPILAQVEGTKKQTGIILATDGVSIPPMSELADTIAPPLNDTQESQLHPIEHLANKPIDITLNYQLTGDMQRYIWKINNEIWPRITPFKIKKGDRVAMVFTNDTSMAHPMHFHGHVFQLTEINGTKLADGPMRDTILVLPHSTKTILFDANNPGIWMTHCHVLYHMAAGMMTTTNYSDFPEPDFYQELIKGHIRE